MTPNFYYGRGTPPAWAEGYVGIPFVERGRDRAGLDCWGLAMLVLAERFGKKSVPDFLDKYHGTRDKSLPAIFVEAIKRWQPVPSPEPGDVVVLKIGGKPWHVGVVIGRNLMLTIDRGTSSVIERIDSARWKGRVDGYYRWVE